MKKAAIWSVAGLLSLSSLAACGPKVGSDGKKGSFHITGQPDAAAVSGFAVGERVHCNWREKGKLYAGQITAVGGGRLHINYDDGDREEITPRLCSKVGGPGADAPAAKSQKQAAPGGGEGQACARDLECGGDLVCEDGKCTAG